MFRFEFECGPNFPPMICLAKGKGKKSRGRECYIAMHRVDLRRFVFGLLHLSQHSHNQYRILMSAVSVKMLERKVLVLLVGTALVREILVGFKTGDKMSVILGESFLLALRRLFLAVALIWRLDKQDPLWPSESWNLC